MASKIYSLNHHWNKALALALPQASGEEGSNVADNDEDDVEEKLIALSDAIFIDPKNPIFYSKRADIYLLIVYLQLSL